MKRRSTTITLAALGFVALSAAAQNSGPPMRDAFTQFRMIGERNIFNANRSGRVMVRPPEPPRVAHLEGFTLVGTMNYRKGLFAFFNGTSPEYRTVLQPGGTIAGHQLVEIATGRVRLASGTNEYALPVGMQLCREEQGPWQIRERPQEYFASASLESHASERRDDHGFDGRSEDRRGDWRNDSRRSEDRGADARADWRGGDSRGWRRNDDRQNDSRRTDGRPPEPTPAAVAPQPGAPPTTRSGPEDAEILRRLMEQRERELR